MENPCIVYVKSNPSGYITEANSSVFLTDITGWTEIDRGYGDRYHHAQNHYFPRHIQTEKGAYCYKLVDGVVAECSAEEITQQESANLPEASLTLEDRVGTLEEDSSEMKEALEMILSGVTE